MSANSEATKVIISDEAKPAVPPVTNTAFVTALAQFVVASVAMMLGNKMAIMHLSAPCTVVGIQAIGTLILLVFCRQNLSPLRMEVAKSWFPIALLFTTMIFTSMKSFVYVNVSTILIFRNIGAILTTIVEYVVRGTTVNAPIIVSELAIVFGAVLYGWGKATFSWVGLFWILLNVCGQVAYGVLLKRQMDEHPLLRDLSKFTMSMYNNLMALPLLLVVMFLMGEHEGLTNKLESVTYDGWFIIAVTCLFGFMISTSGFGLQKLVSATTFLVINNLAKFLNILLGMIFLGDLLENYVDAAGCLIALLAGFWYSWEQMRLNEKKKGGTA